jgi:hypothetical protein
MQNHLSSKADTNFADKWRSFDRNSSFLDKGYGVFLVIKCLVYTTCRFHAAGAFTYVKLVHLKDNGLAQLIALKHKDNLIMERTRGRQQRRHRAIPNRISAGYGDSACKLSKWLSGLKGWQPKLSAGRCPRCTAQRQLDGSAPAPFVRPLRLGPVSECWIGIARYLQMFDLRAQIFALTRSEKHRNCPLFTTLLPLQTRKLPPAFRSRLPLQVNDNCFQLLQTRRDISGLFTCNNRIVHPCQSKVEPPRYRPWSLLLRC